MMEAEIATHAANGFEWIGMAAGLLGMTVWLCLRARRRQR